MHKVLKGFKILHPTIKHIYALILEEQQIQWPDLQESSEHFGWKLMLILKSCQFYLV